VSRSSTEAEYRSLSITTVELFWIRMLLKEIRIYLAVPPVLWCDNIGALALATNPIFHARTKHIEVDYHFVREKVLNRDILLKFISIHDQVADLFTKGLPSAQFLTLKSKLMVVSPSINLQGGVKVYMGSSTHTSKDPQDNTKSARSTALISYAAYTPSKASGSIQLDRIKRCV
jgi:hypothetical protein